MIEDVTKAFCSLLSLLSFPLPPAPFLLSIPAPVCLVPIVYFQQHSVILAKLLSSRSHWVKLKHTPLHSYCTVRHLNHCSLEILRCSVKEKKLIQNEDRLHTAEECNLFIL